jgi:predicted extracellular nuclease
MRNAAVGPNYWNIDVAISRLVRLGTQRLEFRIESFNVLNRFNWGDPAGAALNFNSGQFGRITTQAGAPRIMQFGIKYDF